MIWRRISLAIPFVALLTAFCAGFHRIIEEDFWWHLRLGDDLMGGRGLPRVDTFTYPFAGSPIVDLNWVFQALVSLAHRVGGFGGVIVLKCAIATTAFWIVYRLARRGAPAALAATLTGIGVVLASERLLARPEILSLLLLALMLWLLRRHEEGSNRAWALLPVVTMVWVNSEALFVLGPVAIGAHLLGRLRDRRLWLGFGLSLLATLVNPYFVKGALHPFALFTMFNGKTAIYSSTIGELLSPFTPGIPHPSVIVLPYFLALIGIALLLYGRRPRIHEIVLMAVFLYLGLRARRNLAPLAVVAVPIVARWIGEGRGAEWFRVRMKRVAPLAKTVWTAAASAIVLIAFVGYDVCLANGMIYEAIKTNRYFGVGLAEGAVPAGAAAFLKENRIGGPIFNCLSSGHYLAYSYPQEKAFINGWLVAQTAEHYSNYLSLLSGGESWKRAEQRWGFRCLLLNYAEAPGLTRERLADTTWAPVYLDGTAIVLLREDAANRELIDKCRLTRATLARQFPAIDANGIAALPVAGRENLFKRLFRFGEPVPWTDLYLGQFFAMIGMPDLEAGEYARAVHRAPHMLIPRLLLAGTLGRMGRSDAARQVIESAERLAWTRSQRDAVDQAAKTW